MIQLSSYCNIFLNQKQQFIGKELKVRVKDEESFLKIRDSSQTEQVDTFHKLQNKTYTLIYCQKKYTHED